MDGFQESVAFGLKERSVLAEGEREKQRGENKGIQMPLSGAEGIHQGVCPPSSWVTALEKGHPVSNCAGCVYVRVCV